MRGAPVGLKGSTENIEEEPKPTNDENERTFSTPKILSVSGSFLLFPPNPKQDRPRDRCFGCVTQAHQKN